MTDKKLTGFILKFSEYKFLKETASGNFHFTNIKYFRTLEKHEMTGIKDPNEISQIYKLNPDTDKIILKIPNIQQPLVIKHPHGQVKQNFSRTNKISICSFVFLNLKTDFVTSTTHELAVKPKIVNQLVKEFGNRPGVIWGCGDFAELISHFNVNQSHILQIISGLVNYYEKSNVTIPNFKELNNIEELYTLSFQKENFFKNQREFRLIALCNTEFDFDITSTFKLKNQPLIFSCAKSLQYLRIKNS